MTAVLHLTCMVLSHFRVLKWLLRYLRRLAIGRQDFEQIDEWFLNNWVRELSIYFLFGIDTSARLIVGFNPIPAREYGRESIRNSNRPMHLGFRDREDKWKCKAIVDWVALVLSADLPVFFYIALRHNLGYNVTLYTRSLYSAILMLLCCDRISYT